MPAPRREGERHAKNWWDSWISFLTLMFSYYFSLQIGWVNFSVKIQFRWLFLKLSIFSLLAPSLFVKEARRARYVIEFASAVTSILQTTYWPTVSKNREQWTNWTKTDHLTRNKMTYIIVHLESLQPRKSRNLIDQVGQQLARNLSS